MSTRSFRYFLVQWIMYDLVTMNGYYSYQFNPNKGEVQDGFVILVTYGTGLLSYSMIIVSYRIGLFSYKIFYVMYNSF